MKQLTCEMCGSTDLIKDGGVFVCQSCGCKYSVEEAKRMMIEGTVDVRGTVQVDNSAFVQKYLANARRAKEKEDWAETEKYYNMVEQNDPNNIEAIFYSAYGKAKSSLVENDIYKRQAVFKVLANCISLIDDKYEIEHREENKVVLQSIATDLGKLICSDFVYTEWKNGYGSVTRTNQGETYLLFVTLIEAFRKSIANIAKVDDQPFVHEAALILFKKAAQLMNVGEWKTLMARYIDQENAALERLAKKAIDDYWREHKDEKDALEKEKAKINKQIEELNNSIDALPEVKTVKSLEEQIDTLRREQASLGLFKGKEKKALQEQIDGLKRRLSASNTAKNTAVRPIQAEIGDLRKRIREIDAELTKKR